MQTVFRQSTDVHTFTHFLMHIFMYKSSMAGSNKHADPPRVLKAEARN